MRSISLLLIMTSAFLLCVGKPKFVRQFSNQSMTYTADLYSDGSIKVVNLITGKTVAKFKKNKVGVERVEITQRQVEVSYQDGATNAYFFQEQK